MFAYGFLESLKCNAWKKYICLRDYNHAPFETFNCCIANFVLIFKECQPNVNHIMIIINKMLIIISIHKNNVTFIKQQLINNIEDDFELTI